jgi:hypothetical protein
MVRKRLRNKSICCVALQTASLNVLKYTPRDSLFARLAPGAFYEAA